MTDRVFPDIERAACTMLSQASILNPVLSEWRRLIVSDPGYMGHLDADVQLTLDDRRYIRGVSWIEGEDAFDAIAFMRPLIVDIDVLARILRERYVGWSDASLLRDLAITYTDWIRDAAALYLAWRIVSFRLCGRPSGDVTIQFGHSGLMEHTSLAAAVAQFALDMSKIGSWHVHQEDVKYMAGLDKPAKE